MPMRCVFLGPLFQECPLGLYPTHSWEWSKTDETLEMG
jgi:hypothetical protein